MKHCKYCERDLPADAFAGRKASPDGLAYKCRECDQSYRKARGAGVYKKLRAEHYRNNAEKERAAALTYYRDNRDYCVVRHSAYMSATATQQKEYRDQNRASIALRTLQYRLAKEQRTPSWLSESDIDRITAIYEEREKLEAMLGIPLHVDHEIPLRGETVSGLHVPANLRIVPASVNLSKGNRYGT